MNKKKLHQAIESQTKAKSKITWKRQVSDPLGKGNGSTHLRQTMLKQRAQTTKPKTRKPQRAPLTHMQAPPEPMQLPLDVSMQTTWRKQSRCINLALTGQTGHAHRSDRWARSPSTWELHWSDRCPPSVRPMPRGKLPELKNSSKPLGNLLNACNKPFQTQTFPPCWQCMNQAKNAKNST
jgi:hypothetical protein